jgi:YggT family protein
MIKDALDFLLTTLANLLTFALLLRFYLQWFKAPFQNPLGQMAIALTDFIVKPARKWIPSWNKKDISTILLAIFVQLLLILIILLLKQFPFSLAGSHAWVNACLLALVKVVRLSFDLFFYALFLQAILSWVNPNTPIAGVLDSLTRPILMPIRRFVPIMGGMDFSALIAMILLQMLNISVITHIESYLNSVF